MLSGAKSGVFRWGLGGCGCGRRITGVSPRHRDQTMWVVWPAVYRNTMSDGFVWYKCVCVCVFQGCVLCLAFALGSLEQPTNSLIPSFRSSSLDFLPQQRSDVKGCCILTTCVSAPATPPIPTHGALVHPCQRESHNDHYLTNHTTPHPRPHSNFHPTASTPYQLWIIQPEHQPQDAAAEEHTTPTLSA